MKSLWSEKAAKSLQGIELLVYRSRLIGKEPELVLWGGGNTSMKSEGILYVKGSGSDLKVCEAKDFSPLRLEPLLEAEKKEAMTDEEMVLFLQSHLLDPRAPRPSIETLMHAFLPYDHVDHSHADAIVSVTNNRNNRSLFKKLYGKEIVWVPYTKSGFPLAKRVSAAFRENPGARGAILENHGIFTWGRTAKESYKTMIEMVTRAEEAIQQALKKLQKPLGGILPQKLSQGQRKAFFVRIAPVLREAMKEKGLASFLLRDGEEILNFVNSEKGEEVSQRGPATPEHAMRTKRAPLFLRLSSFQDKKRLPGEVLDGLARFAKDDTDYFHRYASPQDRFVDPYPRVILIPQIGLIAVGKDEKNARIVADIAEHTLKIMTNGMALGGYQSLSEKEVFEMEHWQLELAKLSPPPQSGPASSPRG
jgi:rhamnose utilization protein RhaD (predicted bifunctional aldolase and dehydrogenase)